MVTMMMPMMNDDDNFFNYRFLFVKIDATYFFFWCTNLQQVFMQEGTLLPGLITEADH